MPSCIEMCAGGGGMALGLKRAGWDHNMLIERDHDACETLRNNGHEEVWEMDIRDLVYGGTVDMVCGGPPCQPFSQSGRHKGEDDSRDMLMPALEVALTIMPRVILFENVPGLMQELHKRYRYKLTRVATLAGYAVKWVQFDCERYGVPQRRRRIAFVAVRHMRHMTAWPPLPGRVPRPSLEQVLIESGMPPETVPVLIRGRPSYTIMGGSGHGALVGGPKSYADMAKLGIDGTALAPTITGGSDKHGGADLGPTGTKRLWQNMGIDGHGLANTSGKHNDLVRLTLANVAAIQGFPAGYAFSGKKGAQYRQIGNALPPPAAYQLGIWARTLLTLAQ